MTYVKHLPACVPLDVLADGIDWVDTQNGVVCGTATLAKAKATRLGTAGRADHTVGQERPKGLQDKSSTGKAKTKRRKNGGLTHAERNRRRRARYAKQRANGGDNGQN